MRAPRICGLRTGVTTVPFGQRRVAGLAAQGLSDPQVASRAFRSRMATEQGSLTGAEPAVVRKQQVDVR